MNYYNQINNKLKKLEDLNRLNEDLIAKLNEIVEIKEP